ncbi:hypothetical protein ACIQBJ_35115 [Kitasatospora sp. NPDC088391]|uniref:hypothetical protein n=1 Tax=Kitasatospora sp. NPDC088391 TaxID=3364074 RepID=UPI0038076742
MGLDVVVGLPEAGDPETAEWVADECAMINAVLARAGAPAWSEPPGLTRTPVPMWGYRGLHALRRAAAHVAASGRLPGPPADPYAASRDPVLAVLYRRGSGDPAGPFDHLIHHSDCEGYYVPVDFGPVPYDEDLLGGFLGSSVRLLAELLVLAEALGLPADLDPEGPEVRAAVRLPEAERRGWQRHLSAAGTCLGLLRAARLSTESGAVVGFW